MEDKPVLELKPQYDFFAIMQEFAKINLRNKINRALLYWHVSYILCLCLQYNSHFDILSSNLFILAMIPILLIRNCKTISYKIYKDRINFINYSTNESIETSLYFSDVKDIELSQSKYQKKNDFGTIIFKVKDNAETEYLYNSLFIYQPIQPILVNIKTPQFLYAKIKQLIEEEKINLENKTINEPVIEIKPSPLPKYLMAIFDAGDFDEISYILLLYGILTFICFICFILHIPKDMQLSVSMFSKVICNLLSVYLIVTIYSFLVSIRLKANYKIYSDKIVLFYKEKVILNIADIRDVRTECRLLPGIENIILTTNTYEYIMYGVNNAGCVCSKIKELMENFKK